MKVWRVGYHRHGSNVQLAVWAPTWEEALPIVLAAKRHFSDLYEESGPPPREFRGFGGFSNPP